MVEKFVLMVVVSLLLAACAGSVNLPDGVSAAMRARADVYDAQFPGNGDMNVARACVEKPAALYWNEQIQTYAVACVLESLPDTYGVVLVDVNNVVLNTEHIGAKSLDGLEDLIIGFGWERK